MRYVLDQTNEKFTVVLNDITVFDENTQQHVVMPAGGATWFPYMGESELPQYKAFVADRLVPWASDPSRVSIEARTPNPYWVETRRAVILPHAHLLPEGNVIIQSVAWLDRKVKVETADGRTDFELVLKRDATGNIMLNARGNPVPNRVPVRSLIHIFTENGVSTPRPIDFATAVQMMGGEAPAVTQTVSSF